MCTFILVGFSPDARDAAWALLRSPFHMVETDNASVRASLPEGWHAGVLSDGTCACDMYGRPTPPGESLDERIEKFRAKHRQPRSRKQGWSAAKMARAIEQLKDDYARQSEKSLHGLRMDVRRAIADLAASSGPVWTLVHAFRGAIDTEAIRAATQRVPVANFLNDDALVGFDVWYEVTDA